jgi:hypothetical protein
MFKARKPRPAAASTDKAQIEERTYSSIEVADVAQVSLRQLQWWDERNVRWCLPDMRGIAVSIMPPK